MIWALGTTKWACSPYLLRKCAFAGLICASGAYLRHAPTNRLRRLACAGRISLRDIGACGPICLRQILGPAAQEGLRPSVAFGHISAAQRYEACGLIWLALKRSLSALRALFLSWRRPVISFKGGCTPLEPPALFFILTFGQMSRQSIYRAVAGPPAPL